MTDFNKSAHFTIFVNFFAKDGKKSESQFLKSLHPRDRRLLGWSFVDSNTNEADIGFMTAKIDVARRIRSNIQTVLRNNDLVGEVDIGHWDDNCTNFKNLD